MVSFDDFKNLDLRIAEIVDVEDHPDADKLYVLKINIGTETKQIVAGIRSNYEKDFPKGKRIVFINNLEPAIIRGVESNGMLLAASSEDGPVILTSDSEVPAGSKVG